MADSPPSASLERFINRKRLFVRVQANVNRELFIQKLNAAFPGARIGVGNAERGPVTQRIADITYESAAEAGQALRRNRFKLRVGSHDADITYQIERKDVVEKLAGEWGCRFMVVVKNLPPGEVSCAELSELFESVGEIFTIKILPGNRGEPYALVQYVEEQSVDMSIQQINQQKLHGAVLYVERHLKARRQQGSGNGGALPSPTSSGPQAATTPAGATGAAGSTSHGSGQANGAPAARAPTAAAAVAAGLPGSGGALTAAAAVARGAGAAPAAAPTAAAGKTAPAPPPPPPPPPQQAVAPQATPAAAAVQQAPPPPPPPAAAPAVIGSPTRSTAAGAAAGPADAGQHGHGHGHSASAPAPPGNVVTSPRAQHSSPVGDLGNISSIPSTAASAPQVAAPGPAPAPAASISSSLGPVAGLPTSPTAAQPTPRKASLSSTPSLDNSSSLFSSQHGNVGKPDNHAPLYSSNSNGAVGLPGSAAQSQHSGGHLSHLGLFGSDMSLGGPALTSGLSSSPSSLLGAAAAVGGPSLGSSIPSLGTSLSPSMSLGLGPQTATQQLLTPVVDLFSHLREPTLVQSGISGSSGAPQPDGLTGGAPHSAPSLMHANGHVGGGDVFQGIAASSNAAVGPYTGLLGTRQSNTASQGLLSPTSHFGNGTSAAPGGSIAPTAHHSFLPNGLSSHGSVGATHLSAGTLSQSVGSQQMADAGSNGLLGGLARAGSMAPPANLPANVSTGMQAQPAGLQSPTHKQHPMGVPPPAPPAGLGMGVQRISIRNSLRLALGRLEEIVTCPLTGEIMREPVTAADGYSYECSAIQAWLMAHGAISPVSNEALPHKMLIPNRLAKDIIADILP